MNFGGGERVWKASLQRIEGEEYSMEAPIDRIQFPIGEIRAPVCDENVIKTRNKPSSN